MSYTLRAIIKKEIITEFALPCSPRSTKVIILLGGLPGYPAKKDLIFWLAEKGYWVFLPRYRGTWESGGLLFQKSPHLDVSDVIDVLSSGFTDLWNNQKYQIKNPKVYLIGSSFGGTAAILASTDKRVKKVIAISPVIDWLAESEFSVEPLPKLEKFTEQAFGHAYRLAKNGWQKIRSGNFYNPISALKTLDKNKIYLIAASDDEVVPIGAAKKFVSELNCQFTFLNKGGHSLKINRAVIWKRIEKFLK